MFAYQLLLNIGLPHLIDTSSIDETHQTDVAAKKETAAPPVEEISSPVNSQPSTSCANNSHPAITCCISYDRKNNAKAKEIQRAAGEQYLIHRDLAKALSLYNQSICMAENASEELAVGYANRSAVYFDLGMGVECMANIAMARSVPNYPAYLEAKMFAREMECIRQFAYTYADNEPPVPKLSYPAKEKVPFVADCVEMHRNPYDGRHLRATRKLKVGDVVAIEKPFCTLVASAHQYERCEHCGEERDRNLIPCESCTAVMFCSRECRTEAMGSYHQYECASVEVIKRLNLDPIVMTPIRLMLSALALFKGDIETLYDYTEEADINCDDTTVLDIDYTRKLTPCGQFAPIYCMVNEWNTKKVNDIDMKAIAMIAGYILCHSKKLEGTNRKRNLRRLCKILNHFNTARSVSTYYESIRDMFLSERAKRVGKFFTEGNRGVYPLYYMMNHSCLPNVIAFKCGSQLVTKVLRPIRKGEQLYVSYGPSFSEDEYDDRQAALSPVHCVCNACIEEYPLFDQLPHHSLKVLKEMNQLMRDARTNTSYVLHLLEKHLTKLSEHTRTKDWVMMHRFYWRLNIEYYSKESPEFEVITYDYPSQIDGGCENENNSDTDESQKQEKKF